ncbi:DUF3499 family protein [Egicoccus sp. AB-alg6-2]|uniref:DUF3499 family protein n=1 Tax=Egicoccus sp. AB-alg6-2 TaxID=3242692 RepID=UPI00359E1483
MRGAVVRPLALAAARACSRPGCPGPANATLTFNYAEREAWLAELAETRAPQSYDLCATHAARTQPPHGWRLRDRRPADDQAAPPSGTRPAFDGPDTVALLAAALRAVPDLPNPDAAVPADASAPSGTAASEPAAPGPAAQSSSPAPSSVVRDARDRKPGEAAAATLEGCTTSPALESSAPATSVPQAPRPRPVLAERRRPVAPAEPAADW